MSATEVLTVRQPAELPPEIRTLIAGVFANAPCYPAAVLASQLAEIERQASSMAFVLDVRDGSPTAFVLFGGAGDVALLHWYGVLPAFRGRGIPESVLKWTLGRMAGEGYRSVRCEVLVDNARSQEILVSLGFDIMPRGARTTDGLEYQSWTRNLPG